MSYWELKIDCDEEQLGAVVLRLRALGLRNCLVDRPGDLRLELTAFVGAATTRARMLGLSQVLADDADRLQRRAPRLRFRRTERCETSAEWAPTPVGARLQVQPSHAPPPADGRIAVRLLPRAAFGCDHATTRLCLEALQDRPLDGLALADVGCGSGVLAIAARLLGAAHVSAVDVDPVAVDATRDNAALNGVTLEVQHGGCELLAGRAFDGVVCNALWPVLESLIPRLGALAPWALLSGFREAERARVVARCAEHGWMIARGRNHDGWALVELRRDEA